MPGLMQVYAAATEVAQAYGRPATGAPEAKTSGYAASMTLVMAAPADSPVAWTRAGSLPRSDFIRSVICLMDSASPEPRRMSAGSNQLKQEFRLLADCCCGSRSAKPHRSAQAVQPVSASKAAADCVQPCMATTRGRPAGSPSGTYRNIRSAPGLVPKPVTSVSEAARAAGAKAVQPVPSSVASNASSTATAGSLFVVGGGFVYMAAPSAGLPVRESDSRAVGRPRRTGRRHRHRRRGVWSAHVVVCHGAAPGSDGFRSKRRT
ncbi:hypothetical protein GCM10009730_34520 [Streptomyces albidochromogenes]